MRALCWLLLTNTAALQVGAATTPQAAAATAPAAAAGSNKQTAGATAAAAAALSGPHLPGQPAPGADALLRHLKARGGEFNVAVRKLPSVGRALLAPRAIQQGDVLVRLPLELTYALNDCPEGPEVAARQLLTDMARQDHPLTPYFRLLPGPSEVMCAINMPKSYLPILQDSSTEFTVRLLQAQAQEEWDRHSLGFWQSLGPGMSVSNISYAMALAWTRRFGLPGRSRLVPVAEFANHHAGCKHSSLLLEPCDASSRPQQTAHAAAPAPASSQPSNTAPSSQSPCGHAHAGTAGTDPAAVAAAAAADGAGWCVVWRAGEALAAGQEVCYAYKQVMPQDMALLQYGFLQEGPIAEELSSLDRPEPGTPGVARFLKAPPPAQTDSALPQKFAGTPDEMRKEVLCLSKRLADLAAGQDTVAAIPVDAAADPQGSFLSLMLEWHRQRMRAVEAEVQRLRGLLGAGVSGLAAGVAVS